MGEMFSVGTRSTRGALFVAVMALCIAGCSKNTDDTQAASAKMHDPCALLTRAEVSAALRKPVAVVEKTDATHCLFRSNAGALGAIIVEASWTDADVQFQGGQAANAIMGDSEKTAKVGDASYATAMGNLFYARKGPAYVGIDMRAAAVQVHVVGPDLARKALARM